jgi:RNA polymerase sigma-70 factor, ECF subfamily
VRAEPETERAPPVSIPTFEEFFRRTFPLVARTAALAVRDFELGQDLAQEAFTRLFARWDRMESEAHARNFAYQVALNLARSHLRRESVRQRLGLMRHPVDLGGEGAADDRLTLAAAMAGLSGRQCACLALVDYAGFDAGDAAQLLGMRASTVRVHLTRGRRALAKQLGSTYQGGTDDD